ncbi:MAG: desulfoferrodoxin FeS4 iron-binding domain-containing protein [Cyanobacteria bacterium]|nr:desulfoferrodoxin FeS4 iron-binding domain-containing protein [Cyanobacteriota bacterium]
MTKLLQVYKCGVCGNIVEVIFASAGELVCCNQPMELLKENLVDASLEKHVPVFEQNGDNLIVKVGSIPHPMTFYRQFLKPGDKPEATFCIKYNDKFIIREYCNIHGLWKA